MGVDPTRGDVAAAEPVERVRNEVNPESEPRPFGVHGQFYTCFVNFALPGSNCTFFINFAPPRSPIYIFFVNFAPPGSKFTFVR